MTHPLRPIDAIAHDFLPWARAHVAEHGCQFTDTAGYAWLLARQEAAFASIKGLDCAYEPGPAQMTETTQPTPFSVAA